MSYRKWLYVERFIVIVGGLLCLVGSFQTGESQQAPWMIAGVLIAFIGAFVGLCTLICPSCGKNIPDKLIRFEYCPHCGAKLD